MSCNLILVAGSDGFIGGHLVRDLLNEDRRVRAVDIKATSEWHEVHENADNLVLDLRLADTCRQATAAGASDVYNLACDMGGMGFIENDKALCMLSVLINTHMLRGPKTRVWGVSSTRPRHVCMRRRSRPTRRTGACARATPIRPCPRTAMAGHSSSASGCAGTSARTSTSTPLSRATTTYTARTAPGTADARRRRPTTCRKIAQAKLSGRYEIEIWGYGVQTRSFMFIDDCLYGTKAMFDSAIIEPINIGSNEIVSINQLVDIVEGIAGIRVERNYDPSAPKGVSGRNSDNTMIQERLGWEPGVSLHDGLERTYAWIFDQFAALDVA